MTGVAGTHHRVRSNDRCSGERSSVGARLCHMRETDYQYGRNSKSRIWAHFPRSARPKGKAAKICSERSIDGCGALFTPSPLGPLYDIARTLGGRLLTQLESDAPRAALFSTMLDLLRDPARPTLLVIEDIHWADEATLDLLKYLGRRIAQAHAL